jgi:hypothetical protein
MDLFGEFKRATNSVGNAIGGDVGKFIGNTGDVGGLVQNMAELATLGLAPDDIFGSMFGKPDYDPALKAQQAAFEEEKKRRAMEANRTDMQASQAARLFFGQSTSNPKSDMTNDFLGL